MKAVTFAWGHSIPPDSKGSISHWFLVMKTAMAFTVFLLGIIIIYIIIYIQGHSEVSNADRMGNFASPGGCH